MKNIFLPILFLFFISCKNESKTNDLNSSSSKKPEWEFFNLKGNVKYTEENTFEWLANESIGSRRLENQFQPDQSYSFDANGLLVSRKTQQENGVLIEDNTYEGKDKLLVAKKFSSPTDYVETKYTWEDKNITIITSRKNGMQQLEKQVFNFDKNGLKIAYYKFDAHDVQTFKSTYLYNEKQLCVEEQQYGNSDVMIAKLVYLYNEKGDKTSEIQYNPKNEIVYKSTFSYINHVEVSVKITDAQNKTNSEVTKVIDGKGNIISVLSYDAFNQTNDKEEYSYTDTNLVKSYKVTQNNKVIKEILYSYDDKGNCISEQHKDTNRKLNFIKTITYTFDEKGNWIEKKIKIDNKPSFLVKRRIEYY